MDSSLARWGEGKAAAVPLQVAASVPAQWHSAGRWRLPFQRSGTAPLVVQCYTTLRGTASPVASPRPQQYRFVSFRTALPRLRSHCTSTPAATCHLRSHCTSTPAATCKGPAAAEGVSSTWNVSAVTVVSAIVAPATTYVGIAPACSLMIVKHPTHVGG